MNTTDDGSTDDKTTEEEVEVRVEADADESVNTESQSTEEETSSKNETSEQESREGKRSAGQVIADLGNEKKVIAANLISLAKANEQSRQQVKEMLLNDPTTAGYLKTKFGSDYDMIIGDKEISSEKEEVDVEKIRAEEKAKAEAGAIKSQMQVNHEKLLTEKAKEYGFNSEEFEAYKQKVELLGSDDKALEDAALIVNQAKATAKQGEETIDSGEADKPRTKQVTITPGLSEFSDSRNLDKKKFASEVQRVKDLHRKDAMGKPVMDLPGL